MQTIRVTWIRGPRAVTSNSMGCSSVGVDPRTFEFKMAHPQLYILFCGHRGCGKSTELRQITHILDNPARYCVVFLDALRELDTNNLQYTDVLFALAQALLERLKEKGVTLDQVFMTRLEKWFAERIESH
jgi:energy-coupling factor transporter ATP-binding protein EcfA2